MMLNYLLLGVSGNVCQPGILLYVIDHKDSLKIDTKDKLRARQAASTPKEPY
jgi:hypothetical protein